MNESYSTTRPIPAATMAWLLRLARLGAMLLPLLLAGLPLHGQTLSPGNSSSTERLLEDRLYRIARGYIGIRHEGDIATLTLYNDTLSTVSQSITQYQGLVPIDLIAPPSTILPGNRAILLATTGGQARLFFLTIDSIATIAPLWESELPPLRRIVAVDDFDRDGSAESAIVGDSAFCVVGLDGRMRFAQRGNFLDALLYRRGDSVRFITARRVAGGVITLSLVDPRDGATIASRQIPGNQIALMGLVPSSRGELLGVATIGSQAQGYLFDPGAGLPPPDRFALRGSLPIAFLSYRGDAGLTPAVLLNTYPAPTLLPLLGDQPGLTIEYPLHDGIRGAVVADRHLALLGCDSLALYDLSMQLVGTLPSVCTPDLSIATIDQERLLIASAAGSRVVRVPEPSSRWI